jgi:hypothetical protein
MLGALCHGLPQLCLPQGTHQPFNTAALVPTGAAIALQPEQITPASVTEALRRLLDEPSFRQAAEQLQNQIEECPTRTPSWPTSSHRHRRDEGPPRAFTNASIRLWDTLILPMTGRPQITLGVTSGRPRFRTRAMREWWRRRS